MRLDTLQGLDWGPKVTTRLMLGICLHILSDSQVPCDPGIGVVGGSSGALYYLKVLRTYLDMFQNRYNIWNKDILPPISIAIVAEGIQ